MKNFLLSIVLISVISAVMQLFLPWWIIAVVSFTIAWFVAQKPLAAFATGFISIALLWGLYSWFLSSANDHILAERVTALLKDLTQNSLTALFVLTSVLGGLVGGLASLSGCLLKKALS